MIIARYINTLFRVRTSYFIAAAEHRTWSLVVGPGVLIKAYLSYLLFIYFSSSLVLLLYLLLLYLKLSSYLTQAHLQLIEWKLHFQVLTAYRFFTTASLCWAII